MNVEGDVDKITVGKGPPLEVFETLPSVEEHFKISKITMFQRFFRIFGPRVIALRVSIGSGEFLLGPSQMLLHGMGILWIVGISIVLQVFFARAYRTVLADNHLSQYGEFRSTCHSPSTSVS